MRLSIPSSALIGGSSAANAERSRDGSFGLGMLIFEVTHHFRLTFNCTK